MNKETIKNLALILLLGVTVFSMIRYVAELKAKFRLQDSLIQTQGEVVALTQEKQNLLQELGKEKVLNQQLAAKNLNLRVYLKASKDRMTRLFRDNSRIYNQLEETSAKFTVLKAENRALIDRRKRVYVENEQFKFKLRSVVELRKAIRELKLQKRKSQDLEIQGNRGFLIKDGLLTSERVRIEVTPAQAK